MDKELRHQLLKAAVRDAAFLREAWQDVSADDFVEREESVIAKVATEFYQKYQAPVGAMLRSLVEDEVGKGKWGEQSKGKLGKLLDKVLGFKMEQVSVKALIDRAHDLRRNTFYEKAVEDIVASYEDGKLTADKFATVVDRAVKELNSDPVIYSDYFDEPIKERMARYTAEGYREYPRLLLPTLDDEIQVIGPGHLGMIMAPPGGGKGLCFCHFDIAYAAQGLKGIHFTLEDPKSLVEKRLDANLSGVPLAKLRTRRKRVRLRYKRALRRIKGKLRIVDATDGTWTVSKIERVYEQFKQEGYIADFIVIDYDDEIICEKPFKGESARRQEFAEIYKRLRKFAKNNNLIVWIAAQTAKSAVGLQIISSKHVAEDYSKIRKVFFAMSIGQHKKRKDVRWLQVVKHRLDKQDFGVPIVANYDAAIFCDEDATINLKPEDLE